MAATLSRVACFGAALALSFSGCTSETGIIIEVSQGTLEAQPDSLRFYFGIQVDDLALEMPGCSQALRFQDGAPLADRVVSIAGRDLSQIPFRMMFQPGNDWDGQPAMVAVAALSGESVVGLGRLDTPVSFVEGKVLSWPLALSAPNGELSMTEANCVCASTAEGMVAITPQGDADCDMDVGDLDCDDSNPLVGDSQVELCGNEIDDDCNGRIDEREDKDGDGRFTCENDCDDENPNIYLDAPEICDGFDNDCIPGNERYPFRVECYTSGEDGTDPATCFTGHRFCDDFGGEDGGWESVCRSLGDEPHYEASTESCKEFGHCEDDPNVDYPDAYQCSDVAVYDDVECTMLVRQVQGYYDTCGGVAFLNAEGSSPGSECRWTLQGGIDQGGFSVELLSEQGTVGNGAVIDACQARLNIFEIQAIPPDPVGTTSFKLWSSVDGEAKDHLRIKLDIEMLQENQACPILESGLTCSNLTTIPFDPNLAP